MLPLRKEIEESVGESIPDNAPIKEVSSLPTPQELLSEGVIFKAASTINNKWKVFLSAKFGNIVAVYLLLITLGFDIPKPIPLAIRTYDSFQEISSYVFSYMQDPKDEPEGYLVSLPSEFPLPTDNKKINLSDLPEGSGVHPVSGSYLV